MVSGLLLMIMRHRLDIFGFFRHTNKSKFPIALVKKEKNVTNVAIVLNILKLILNNYNFLHLIE
jgi:hypothetical protein